MWCRNRSDIENVIEQVRCLDTDDKAYVEMLMQQPLIDKEYLRHKYAELERFLLQIFSQDKNTAARRIKYFCAESHERYLREYEERYRRTPELVHKVKDKLRSMLS